MIARARAAIRARAGGSPRAQASPPTKARAGRTPRVQAPASTEVRATTRPRPTASTEARTGATTQARSTASSEARPRATDQARPAPTGAGATRLAGGSARARASMRSRRRWRRRLPLVAALVVALALVVGGWLWLRDSSLVSVRHVKVTGVSGPDAPQIRTALVSAAHSMTTLDVNTARLRTAVAPYAVVKDLQVSTDFPHGMRIHVIEEVPVAAVVVGGHSIAVSDDGTLLPDVRQSPLPAIALSTLPNANRVTSQGVLGALKVLAAAPNGWLERISQVSANGSQGIAAQIRGGPVIYFGDPSQAQAKWLAVGAVLADPGSAGAAYIDVTDPQRPAAGSGSDTNTAGGVSDTNTAGGVSDTNTAATTTIANGAATTTNATTAATTTATTSTTQ
jgi:cell division protein FtsQ